MSTFGTLHVAEDHGETYYVFDRDQKILAILEKIEKLKGYEKRKIMKARHMFS